MASTRCKPKGAPPLCACGCGQPTHWDASHNRWSTRLAGHQNIGQPSKLRIDKGEPPLCACGCGQPVRTYRHPTGWVRYLNNHAPRQPHTPEAIEKMRQAALTRNIEGSANPSWHGGAAPETYQNHPSRQQKHQWRMIRQLVRQRDNNQCILCGNTTHLDTHHVDGDSENTTIENLVTLCHRCHAQAEFSKKRDTLRERIIAYMQHINVPI